MIYQELKNKSSISVTEAADLIGMSPQTLQAGLKQNAFPFGVGFKGNGSTYYYYIHRGLLEQFLEGKLPFGIIGGALYGN